MDTRFPPLLSQRQIDRWSPRPRPHPEPAISLPYGEWLLALAGVVLLLG